MLRRRNVNIKTVKELDGFPKVPELYVDKTAVGGTCKFFVLLFTALIIKYNILLLQVRFLYLQSLYLQSALLHI